jgi:hypothetical protein
MNGSDVACCGYGTRAACQTIGQAMQLIDSAQAQNVTINATVDAGGGDWASAETYPVALGWGVELSAPGVFFLDANKTNGASIFDIKFYSSSDTVGYASIVGTAASPVGVGMNAANSSQTDANAAIAVEKGNTLNIANARVNGSANNPDSLEAISVHGGASLMLGQDHAGAVTGTVTIGNALGAKATDGLGGIVCLADTTHQLGCTINDAQIAPTSSVVIQGQEGIDIDIEDYASVSLTSDPVVGVAPSTRGFGNCPQKNDAMGSKPSILVNGLATLTFKNGMVQCIGAPAFRLQSSANGSPTVTIDQTVVQNTDVGIYASAGTATVTNSTMQFNFIGVWQDTDGTHNGTIDLSGGNNTVVCSNKSESSQGTLDAGIDVFNSSGKKLNASNVAWDTSGPDYFTCNWTLTSCVCDIASCTNTAGSDDMDAVTLDAGITTTGAAQSGIAIDAGCI